MSEKLVIPIEFAGDPAIAALQKINRATKAAGQSGKKAGDDIGKGMGGAAGAASMLGANLAGVMSIAQQVATSGKAAMSMMVDEFKRSTDHCRELAKDFATLRSSMQEVATLRNEANTNQFTVDEAGKAAKFSLTPEERRDAQAQFLNFTGAQIGDENGKKLTTDQADDFSSRIAVMMKSAGYKPAAGMNLGGSILQQKTGPQDVDKLMKEFSVAFQVMEKGQVAIEGAAPEVAELMAMGVSSEDAAKMFSVAAPAAPGQEGKSVQAAMRAIEELKIGGNGAAFGVSNKMNPYESVKAFGQNMAKRKEKLLATGMGEEEAKTAVAAQLKKAGVAADVRERRGLVAGFGRMGTELGGFETFEAVARGTSDDFEAERRRRYEGSAEGRRAKGLADNAKIKAERGARQQSLMLERQNAANVVEGSGILEQPQGWLDTAATKASEHLWGQGDFKEQEINRLTATRIRQGLQGSRRGRDYLAGPISPGSNQTREQALNMGTSGVSPGDNFLAKAANELEKIRELNQQSLDAQNKRNEIAERAAKKPLAAPPAFMDGVRM